MPRRSPKLPVASPGSAPDFSIRDADWHRIETKYGKKLPGSVREAILEATREFVYAEAFERSAEPVSDAAKFIESFKKAAANLSRVMLSGGSSDAAVYARHIVERHFLDPRLSDTADGSYVGRFYSLSGILTSFQSACFRALIELEPAPSTMGVLGDLGALSSFKEGEAWDQWIRRLTEIIKNAGLPSGVRKDDKSPSRFVTFLWELQKSLPSECRLPYAETALPTAISQARRRSLRLSSALRALKTGSKKPPAKSK